MHATVMLHPDTNEAPVINRSDSGEHTWLTFGAPGETILFLTPAFAASLIEVLTDLMERWAAEGAIPEVE